MDNLVCNMCGNLICKNEFGYIKDHLSIEKRWQYGSKFDNEIHNLHICEECYEQFLNNCKHYPQTLNIL